MKLFVEVTWDNGIDGSDYEEIHADSLKKEDVINAIKSRYGYVEVLIFNGSYVEVKSKFKGNFRVYLPRKF